MLSRVVIEEELVAVLSHLLDVRGKHTVNGLDKGIDRIAWAIESIAVLFCQRTCIAVRIRTGNDGLTTHQVGQQTAGVVGDGEAIVEEYQPYIASIS